MTGSGPPTRERILRLLVLAAGGVACLQVLVAVVLVPVVGFSWSEALTSFLATNGLMGLAFALSGVLIAWYRPGNAIGWLLVADGLGHATAALMAPLGELLYDHQAPTWVLRLVATVFMGSWPWSIALFLPLVLLVFPDGHLPGRGWRLAAWAVALTSPLFVLEMLAGDEPVSDHLPPDLVSFALPTSLDWVWTVSEVRTVGALLLAVTGLCVRYRRADETQRRQLLWLVLAGAVVVAAVAPWSFVAGTPIAVLFAIPLVPAAIAVAVVRHQLLDIRLVLARALAWLLLSAAAVAAYVALVALLATFVSAAFGRSVFASVVVAVLLAPLLPRLQREAERWVYGERRDPARVAGRVGEQLAAGDQGGVQSVVEALRTALRFPYVALEDETGRVASDGIPVAALSRLPLDYGGVRVGTLVIGLRAGERELTSPDALTLRLVAAPFAVALGAWRLSSDLQSSRERLVTAREEERRRLRRDLHDGVGPALTGIALTADAAANFLDDDPARTRELLESLRAGVRTAIADVRRAVDDLRPPSLDEVGLVGALQQRVDQLRWSADGNALDVRIVVPRSLPPLPAAVEVAAYRIATEALVNVARHAGATSAVVQIRCQDTLDVEVTDDGSGHVGWSPGVGLAAMRERAGEVGGRVEAGPSPSGGRVFVSIPMGAS